MTTRPARLVMIELLPENQPPGSDESAQRRLTELGLTTTQMIAAPYRGPTGQPCCRYFAVYRVPEPVSDCRVAAIGDEAVIHGSDCNMVRRIERYGKRTPLQWCKRREAGGSFGFVDLAEASKGVTA